MGMPSVPRLFLHSIFLSLVGSLVGCASVEENRIQTQFKACTAPLTKDARYLEAKNILEPAGGITPTMMADDTLPAGDDLARYAPYLDALTRCERQRLDSIGEAFYMDKEQFHVIRKQYRARWLNFAGLLSGEITYGEFFTEQERIQAASEDQIAGMERRREYEASERKASVDQACTAAGGRWNGFRCEPVLGDSNREINCTTDGKTTTCSS